MGDSLSRSSESCFEEVRVGGQCVCDLGKKDMKPTHMLVEGCFTQEEQIPWLMLLVLPKYG